MGAIGSVNLSEFFVTIAEAATFFAVVGRLLQQRIIVGLIAGGVLAARLQHTSARDCRLEH